jgi:hypothetical protein
MRLFEIGVQSSATLLPKGSNIIARDLATNGI